MSLMMPSLLGFFEREGVAGDHQLDGLALAHHARQALRAAGAGKHAEVHFRQADLARVLARNADVGRHGDFQPTADAVTVDGRDHQLGRVLQAQQHLVGVQAEVVLEGRIDAGQHLDVRARGEELVARAGQHDHVDVVVHARLEDGLIELAVHFVGVSIGRRIEHLDHGHAAVGAVVDQCLRGFAGGRLHCGCHVETPSFLKMSCRVAKSCCLERVAQALFRDASSRARYPAAEICRPSRAQVPAASASTRGLYQV